MRKYIIVLAVLALVTPALAAIDIIMEDLGDGVVAIKYDANGGVLPRAFALDITSSDANITEIDNFFVGECDDVAQGYGIFPAAFRREINVADPNWVAAGYTPIADQNDYPADTEYGLGSKGITIELGSVYDTTVDPGLQNKPADQDTLCEILVEGDTTLCITTNAIRGAVVLEDLQPADVNLPDCLAVEISTVCLGDTSGGAGVPDGKIDLTDVTRAVTLIKDVAGLEVTLTDLSPEDQAKYGPADCSGGSGLPDGKINLSDVTRIVTFIKDEPGLEKFSCICLDGNQVVPCE